MSAKADINAKPLAVAITSSGNTHGNTQYTHYKADASIIQELNGAKNLRINAQINIPAFKQLFLSVHSGDKICIVDLSLTAQVCFPHLRYFLE